MDQGDVRAYVKYCDEHANPLVAYASDRIFVLQPGHPYLVASMNLGGVKYDRFLPFDDAFSDRILQFTAFFHAGEEEARVMAMMPHSHTERWHPEFTDILHNGANKGTGLRNMAAHFGIPVEQTLAMGDGGNDVPMLEAAGIGVAMGNALEEVKAAAEGAVEEAKEKAADIAEAAEEAAADAQEEVKAAVDEVADAVKEIVE